jgi:hypothetical protein
MASSSEAFEKFSIWKKLKTPLRVTVIVGGTIEDVVLCKIFGVDEEASQVGIVRDKDWSRAIDVEDATFALESGRITATRNESDWIIFEELSG